MATTSKTTVATALLTVAVASLPAAAATMHCQFGKLPAMTFDFPADGSDTTLRIGKATPVPVTVGAGKDALMTAEDAKGNGYVFYIHQNATDLNITDTSGKETKFSGKCK